MSCFDCNYIEFNSLSLGSGSELIVINDSKILSQRGG